MRCRLQTQTRRPPKNADKIDARKAVDGKTVRDIREEAEQIINDLAAKDVDDAVKKLTLQMFTKALESAGDTDADDKKE
jgi:hypothetical protein